MTNAMDYLSRVQNADGGWGYRAQGMSFVEPTAAALFALGANTLALSAVEGRARDFLLARQHRDGGWGIAAIDDESGWMTAWAVWALATIGGADDAVARGVAWLGATPVFRVEAIAERASLKQLLAIDSALRGWPWQPGDASWVHPTALAMLAMCAANHRAHPRVREGRDYLFDRANTQGGWNVGSPSSLGATMPATIQDTAMALLALRALGEAAHEPRIANALRFLRDALATLNTPAELAWAMWGLGEWRVEIGDWRARLNTMQNADGSWQGNPFITAIALTSQK